MQLLHQRQIGRVAQIQRGIVEVIVGGGAHVSDLDRGHLVRAGHPALEAGQVEFQHTDQRGQAAQQDQTALPAPPEDPKPLAQQHFGHEIARRAAQKEERQQGPGVLGQTVEKHPVQERAQSHGGAGAHAVLEDGAHPAHTDDVSGTLQRAAPVDQQGQPGQDQPRQGIEQHHVQSVELDVHPVAARIDQI